MKGTYMQAFRAQAEADACKKTKLQPSTPTSTHATITEAGRLRSNWI